MRGLLYVDYWKYLLMKSKIPSDEGFIFWRKMKSFNCRRKSHPCGVIWFNVSGLEPDMTCRDCYDNLG